MRTQHAFLVAWGWFAEATGLIEKIGTVSMQQKAYKHSAQGKVLEFPGRYPGRDETFTRTEFGGPSIGS
jgi:hypothetical protein